jgi:hypothetical protein
MVHEQGPFATLLFIHFHPLLSRQTDNWFAAALTFSKGCR